jgi:hypothetical protein
MLDLQVQPVEIMDDVSKAVPGVVPEMNGNGFIKSGGE